MSNAPEYLQRVRRSLVLAHATSALDFRSPKLPQGGAGDLCDGTLKIRR
jgi:hypothetical protein